jgi:hypothetical protein
MIFMGQRRTKKGHDTIVGKLVDGPLMPVYFTHQDLETSVHNLMHFLRVRLLRDGGVIRHVCEKHCHDLPLAFYGTSAREDLLSKEFGGVGLRLGIVDGTGFFFWLLQILAAFTAEYIIQGNLSSTLRASKQEFRSAFATGLIIIRVFRLAFWAFHLSLSHRKRRILL